MKRPLFWVCACLSLLAVLNLYFCGAFDGTERPLQASAEDPPWEGQLVRFSGKVCGREVLGETEYFLITNLNPIQDAAASRQIISLLQELKTDRVQCFLAAGSFVSMPKIGSTVLVEGEFSFFVGATNPGEFDFARYYQGKRIGGKMNDVRVLAEGADYSRVMELLCELKSYFGRRLDQIFPQREAGTMRTILLGDRTELDPEVKEIYQKGGIIHVLSISGLHVTLLGMGLYQLLRRLGMRNGFAAACASVVLVLYGLMTGMSVSACRAIGMFLFRMLGTVLGRTYDLLTAAGVMACAMLCTVPAYGMNSGFWLSFGSVMGVGVILPLLEKAAPGKSGGAKRGKRALMLAARCLKGIKAGFAVFLTTLPLMLLFYYEVPTYAMLLNLLVIPAMGPVILFGMLAMLIPGLGILGTVDVVLLGLFEKLCLWTEKLPFSTWNPGCPRAWQIVVYYLVLGSVMVLLGKTASRKEDGDKNRKNRVEDGEGTFWRKAGNLWRSALKIWRKGLKSLPAAYLLLALPTLIFLIPTHRMTGIVFLDVGQGDCVILRLENGQTWINDCGSSSKNKVGENILIPYLKHEGIRHVDGIFISHGDSDHVSGLMELFAAAEKDEIRIDRLYLPDWMKEVQEEVRKEVQEEAQGGSKEAIFNLAKRVPGMQMLNLKAGDILRGAGISMVTLHPEPSQSVGLAKEINQNEASLCLFVRMERQGKEMTVLLTGDVEGEGERQLAARMQSLGILKVDVLKCSHHGSRNATSDEFLEGLDARLAVISCGRRNRYGHPAPELLERLAADKTAILCTGQNGAVILSIAKMDGDHMSNLVKKLYK